MHFFAIPLSSRHEKGCRMSEKMFCLFQCSRNIGWGCNYMVHLCSNSSHLAIEGAGRFCHFQISTTYLDRTFYYWILKVSSLRPNKSWIKWTLLIHIPSTYLLNYALSRYLFKYTIGWCYFWSSILILMHLHFLYIILQFLYCSMKFL